MDVRMGVIGAGRIGKLHAEHVANRVPGARLVAITDVNVEAAQQCAERFGAVALADHKALLDRSDIDAVAICSSTDTHAQFIIDAAQAGKHIFCEKPIDHSLARIDAALDAVDRAGVKLQIGFNRRFDANYARVRKAIAQGEIGETRLLHIISRDPGPPPLAYVRVSGGIFLDMTIHDFDMARFLIGCDVEEVFCAAGVRVDPAIGEAGDLDTALITLTFADGTLGVIDNCRQAVYGYDQRVEVLGSLGAIQTDNNYGNTAIISGARSIQRDLPLNFFMDRYVDSYVAELRAFVHAIADNDAVPVTGRDGRAPVVMALATRKSYDERRPVKIAEIA